MQNFKSKITLEEENGRIIKEEKYSIGWALLAFDDYTKETNKVVFKVDGKTAKDNLRDVLAHIGANKNEENEKALEKIEHELLYLLGKFRDDKVYIADYSEAMGVVENPNYDPYAMLEEVREQLEDVISGYARFAPKDDAVEQLAAYVGGISPQVRFNMVWSNTDSFATIGMALTLNAADKDFIVKHRVTNDNVEYDARYAQRKLFYILKNAGIKSEICRRHIVDTCHNCCKNECDTCKTCKKNTGFPRQSNKHDTWYFYVTVARKDLEEWVKTKPFVKCSYRLRSTYDIEYYAQNNPTEKEKFFCYASNQQNFVSVIIEDTQLLNASDEFVSQIIGKPLVRGCYNFDEINMKPMR